MVEKKTAFCVRFVDSDHTAAYTHTYQKKKSKTVKRERKENTDNIQKKKRGAYMCWLSNKARNQLLLLGKRPCKGEEKRKKKSRVGFAERMCPRNSICLKNQIKKKFSFWPTPNDNKRKANGQNMKALKQQ